MKKMIAVFCILLLSITTDVFSCEFNPVSNKFEVYFPPKFDSAFPETDYVFQLIEHIIKHSEAEYGPCEVKLLNYRLPLKRVEHYLEQNQVIDVASFTVNSHRDERFLPIQFPIDKGLMGYRLLMIREGDSDKFQSIESLKQLSYLGAGQGSDWVDADILAANGLNVITAGSIKTLIDMLVHSRFDYFPRGALQIITEINAYKEKPIQVEPNILLSYPSVAALYVNKENHKLAERLTFGLQKMRKEGLFDQFFYAHASSIQALNIIKLDTRNIITICNPLLPDWVPLDQPEYWLTPWPANLTQMQCKAGD